MDLYYQYDENLSNNEFFKKLQSEHKIIIETAPLENWIVCIPRSTTLQLQKENLVDPNFILAHILIPNDELPKTHFTNLLGHDIHLENQKLVNNKGLESIVLFEEVFYTKSFMKYKVWCVECPLYGDRLPKTTGIFIVRDLRDAIELIWNETQSKVVFRKIDNACTTFINQHKKEKKEGLDQLRTSIQLLYTHCLQMLMFNKRLKEKCRQDLHFYKILKIALETYIMSNLYDYVFDAISVHTLEDGQQFNRKVRSLAQVHLTYFGIDQKCSDLVTNVRAELLKIEDYSTAVEKLACLRRSLNATSRHAPKNLCVDELISILVFVIIKSGLTHWFATFKFLKDFILNDLTELADKGADSFLITTLEAAIFYIKTFNETKRPVDGPVTTVEQQNKFSSKADFINSLFDHIRAGHEQEVLRLLTSENEIEIVKNTPLLTLCHPLCDCENCSIIIDEKPNVNTPNCNGITALHVASMNGLPKMVNLILALDADLTAVDENNWTALHYAAARGHQNVLLLLLHAGVEINCQTNDKFTPLHLSCLNGHQGCVKALLYYSDHIKVKIDKNLPNKMGDTPLHLAALWGFVECIETLVEYNAGIDRINRLGHTASDYSHNSFITELLQNTFVIVDDDPNITWSNNDSQANKPEPFRGYIDEKSIKANNEQYRKTDNDKIIAAIRNGDIKLAYYFLGLNLQENGNRPCHPLCTCDMCSEKDETKNLNEYNFTNNEVVDVNGCNSEGVTLLHAAALIGNMNLIQYLLSQGASVNKKTLKNETVLHFAVKSKSPDVIELILGKVSEETLNSTDDDGNTALHLAVDSGNSQVECALRNKLTVRTPDRLDPDNETLSDHDASTC